MCTYQDGLDQKLTALLAEGECTLEHALQNARTVFGADPAALLLVCYAELQTHSSSFGR